MVNHVDYMLVSLGGRELIAAPRVEPKRLRAMRFLLVLLTGGSVCLFPRTSEGGPTSSSSALLLLKWATRPCYTQGRRRWGRERRREEGGGPRGKTHYEGKEECFNAALARKRNIEGFMFCEFRCFFLLVIS